MFSVSIVDEGWHLSFIYEKRVLLHSELIVDFLHFAKINEQGEFHFAVLLVLEHGNEKGLASILLWIETDWLFIHCLKSIHARLLGFLFNTSALQQLAFIEFYT
jgi:hypothetical protein